MTDVKQHELMHKGHYFFCTLKPGFTSALIMEYLVKKMCFTLFSCEQLCARLRVVGTRKSILVCKGFLCVYCAYSVMGLQRHLEYVSLLGLWGWEAFSRLNKQECWEIRSLSDSISDLLSCMKASFHPVKPDLYFYQREIDCSNCCVVFVY